MPPSNTPASPSLAYERFRIVPPSFSCTVRGCPLGYSGLSTKAFDGTAAPVHSALVPNGNKDSTMAVYTRGLETRLVFEFIVSNLQGLVKTMPEPARVASL